MKQLAPQIPVNCKQLSSDVSMSWVVDDTNNAIIIKLCGCVQVSVHARIVCNLSSLLP